MKDCWYQGVPDEHKSTFAPANVAKLPFPKRMEIAKEIAYKTKMRPLVSSNYCTVQLE